MDTRESQGLSGFHGRCCERGAGQDPRGRIRATVAQPTALDGPHECPGESWRLHDGTLHHVHNVGGVADVFELVRLQHEQVRELAHLERTMACRVHSKVAPWRELVRMADDGEADLALLQEAGNPPGELVHLVEYEDAVLWNRQLYDRWPLVVKLSDRIKSRALPAGAADQ